MHKQLSIFRSMADTVFDDGMTQYGSHASNGSARLVVMEPYMADQRGI